MPSPSYNKVIVNLAALRKNFKAIQGLVGPEVKILAMVKADAYGHGLIPSATALSAAGALRFGVAELDEGVALRRAGVAGDLVIFLGCQDAHELIIHKLTPVVFDLDNVRHLSAEAVKHNKSRIGVHLKIDVGMGRLGIMPSELKVFAREIDRLPGVFLAGILGHFPMADQVDLQGLTLAQNGKFNRFIEKLKADAVKIGGVEPDLCHVANSAALIRYPETHHQMVRPGITLYGCYPADDQGCCERIALQAVMSFKTQIVQLKEVPSGYGISYGHLFETTRPSCLAVLPVGYANGYLRSLTGKAQVLIRGQRAPICGRICMNACVVDVTDIPEVKVADEVVLLGRQSCGKLEGMISADEVAGWMNTISYEVLCLFGNNNQREYHDTEAGDGDF